MLTIWGPNWQVWASAICIMLCIQQLLLSDHNIWLFSLNTMAGMADSDMIHKHSLEMVQRVNKYLMNVPKSITIADSFHILSRHMNMKENANTGWPA